MPAQPLLALLRHPPVRLNTPPAIHRHEGAGPWAPPPLPDYDLFFVLDGGAELTLNGRPAACAPNICYIFPPGSRIVCHQDRRQPYRNFAVHFDLSAKNLPAFPSTGQIVRDAAFFTVLARQCEAVWRTGGEWGQAAAAWLVTQMLLHLWFESQSPHRPVTDSRVAGAIGAVLEDPGRHWSVAALAQKSGLSRAQFARHLTAATGTAPEQFLIRARVDRAKHLLRETDMTISQIADALGYRDVFYFSRQFRRVAGMTASSYRR